MIRNSLNSYGKVTKFFHWLMAILLISMFVFGYTMTTMKTDSRFELFEFHKATGLLLFSLVTLRLVWRWINPQPPLPLTVPRWQRIASDINIFVLYLCMFLMPISGFLTSTLGNHPIFFYGLFTITPLANNPTASDFFAYAHTTIAYLMMIFFSLHVLAAAYHRYFLKDGVESRMAVFSLEE